MAGILEDLRIASRLLRKHPAASLAAVAALAIGIGFSTAAYSVADVLLYRPLLVDGIDRLVLIFTREERSGRTFSALSATDIEDIKAASKSLESVAAFHAWTASPTGHGDPEQVDAWRVSASFFTTFGVQPVAGRLFLPQEEEPGMDRSVLLGYRLWQTHFGGDRSAVGKTIELDGRKFGIAGVMPEHFSYPQAVQLWAPLAMTPQQRNDPSAFYLRAVAKLKPGVSFDQARAEIVEIGNRISADRPLTHRAVSKRVEVFREYLSGDLTAGYTRITMAAVVFLMLIACANVANLQMTRVFARSREMGVRMALGASRWRIVRAVLSENLLLAAIGGVAGCFMSLWWLDLLKTGMPPEVERFIPGWRRLGLNGRVLFWTAFTACAAGIAAGLAPAVWIGLTSGAGRWLESARGATAGRARRRLRGAFIVSEVALCVVLLAGAALMLKGFRSLTLIPAAAEPARILTFRISLPAARYAGDQERREFHRRALENLEGIAGASSASLVSNAPYSQTSNSWFFRLEGEADDRDPKKIAQMQSIDTDYFTTLGLRIVEGRDFSMGDGPDSKQVAVVSQTFARRFLGGRNPVGMRVYLGGESTPLEIVGVAQDILHEFTDRAPAPVLYRPFAQSPPPAADYLVKTHTDPMKLAASARRAIGEIDAQMPLHLMRTFEKLIGDALTGFGYVAWILAVLGGVALFLATIGVYSLVTWSVEERTREIGIRIALGAKARDILSLVMRGGLRLTGAGLLIGLALSVMLTRMLSGLIYGVSQSDPWVFLGVCVSLAAAAALACWAPSRRALGTDPAATLRSE
jgi:putative ABC transport system permease protein